MMLTTPPLAQTLRREGMRQQATRFRPSATSVCGLKLLTDAAVANNFFFLRRRVRILVAGQRFNSAARLYIIEFFQIIFC
jgi:hypothetical protein